MRVLLIKTSSMGDIIHTLPALTDAGRALPGIKFDWVIEEAFSEIPRWHPLVDRIIPAPIRRFRKGIFSQATRAGWRALRKELQDQDYDLILDAQGLIKSAFLTFFTKGIRAGLDWGSARESLASLAYQRQCTVNFHQHAIVRMRSLFSQALGYRLPDTAPDFNLDSSVFKQADKQEKYLVFLHGTTWVTKQWPETYWVALATLAAKEGYRIKISGGNEAELARAKRIALQAPSDVVELVPRLSITNMASLIANAKAAIAVDTGFGHLAAALNVPIVSLYGATNPKYTSAIGKQSLHLAADFPCAPCLSRTCTYKKTKEVTPACYTTIPPERVWETVLAAVIHT